MAERGMPGLRRLDHVGVTVPDLAQATAFFCDVLGCEPLYAMGELRRDDDWMAEHLNVHPRSVLRGLNFLRCADGAHIELFEYQAPDQRPMPPRNTDIGGHHLAFYVDDIDAAAAHLQAHGVRLLGGVKASANGPSAGQRWVYFLTPWDLQCELVSYPHGKAYETSAS